MIKKQKYLCVDTNGNCGEGADVEAAYNRMLDQSGSSDAAPDCVFYKAMEIEVKVEIKEVLTEK